MLAVGGLHRGGRNIGVEPAGEQHGVGATGQTSEHASNKPEQTTPHSSQVQASAPARMGWLQCSAICEPKSWHNPIG